MSIGQQIKKLREDKGWSQGELAKRVNTSQPAISRAESEHYDKLTLTTLQRIADILECKVVVDLVR